MATTNPLWVDLTWGAGGSTFDKTLDICGHLTQFMGLDVLMHLTCTGLTRDRVIESLDRAKEYGIKIFSLLEVIHQPVLKTGLQLKMASSMQPNSSLSSEKDTETTSVLLLLDTQRCT